MIRVNGRLDPISGSVPLTKEIVEEMFYTLYPGAFLWAFAARSLWRVGTVLVGGGALMAAAASLIQIRLT